MSDADPYSVSALSIANVSADLMANAATSGYWNGAWSFLVNPGFSVLFIHRLACWMKLKRQNRLADLVWNWNVRRSGCHLHLNAQIGPGLKLPHPVGVVIGMGSKIGTGVTLYQGTTLGRVPSSEDYPVIEADVIIYPNSVIAGPIVLGKGAVVGALSYVDRDIPAHCVVAGAPAKIIRGPFAGSVNTGQSVSDA